MSGIVNLTSGTCSCRGRDRKYFEFCRSVSVRRTLGPIVSVSRSVHLVRRIVVQSIHRRCSAIRLANYVQSTYLHSAYVLTYVELYYGTVLHTGPKDRSKILSLGRSVRSGPKTEISVATPMFMR
jgi:hypothetical protein